MSARPSKPEGTEPVEGAAAVARDEDSDQDLRRAKDLLDLHGSVKLAHQDGTDKELNEAREAVANVLRDL